MVRKKQKRVNWKVAAIAILCLTAAEITALLCGINGKFYSLYCIIVAGIAGYSLPRKFTFK